MQQETIDEAADLVYHLIVLLADAGLSLEDVARLKARHAVGSEKYVLLTGAAQDSDLKSIV